MTQTQPRLEEVSAQKRNISTQRSTFMGGSWDGRAEVKRRKWPASVWRTQEGFSEEVTYKPELACERTVV